MRFQPQTEQQVQESSSRFGPWKNGIYDFEVGEAEETVSKAGNEMIKLTIYVYNPEGDRRIVYDYLVETVPHKLRHAAAACGLIDKYESGEITGVDFYGRTGRLKLGIQPEKDGFQAKNVIRDYLPATLPAGAPVVRPPAPARTPAPPWSASKASKVPAGAGTDLDDEIPF